MLNGRETLREELQMKFIAKSDFGSYNHTNQSSFHVAMEGPSGESDVTDIPTSMWMDTVRGVSSADALRATQIQVEQRVVALAI